MKEDDARLKALADEVFGIHGYSSGEIAFQKSKDFSFRWGVRGNNINFYLSDYIIDAPDEIIKEFIECAFTYIIPQKTHPYGQNYYNYMTSDEFILKKRPIYIKRSRNLAMNDIGNYRCLYDSVERLLDAGLLRDSDIENTVFTWTSTPNYGRLGYCSGLMRVVAITNVLDSLEFSENALDYVVYHECLHLRQGYRPFDRNPHDAQFKRDIKLYPGMDEAEKEIRRIPLMNPAKKKPRSKKRR